MCSSVTSVLAGLFSARSTSVSSVKYKGSHLLRIDDDDDDGAEGNGAPPPGIYLIANNT